MLQRTYFTMKEYCW